MPRIRTIKPGFFANEGLSEVSEPAQILAGGLLCYADDDGYFNAHPGLVKAAVFPLREPSKPVAEMLNELARIGYVKFGRGKDGKRYGHVVNFSEHQKVSHPIPSKIKNMEIVWEDSGNIPETSVNPPEVLRPELNGMELNRRERKKKPSPQKPAEVLPQDSWHQRIQAMVKTAWSEHNGGTPCPWGVEDGAQLKLMRSKSPGWSDGQYAQCLSNMYATEGFPRSKLPFEFLPRLCSFLSGPRNEFNREQGNGQTRSVSKADAREQRIIDRAIKYRTVSAGAVDSASNSALALPGNGGTGVCGLDGSAEILPPERDPASPRPPHAAAAKAGVT